VWGAQPPRGSRDGLAYGKRHRSIDGADARIEEIFAVVFVELIVMFTEEELEGIF
jgi:hypothetical protein